MRWWAGMPKIAFIQVAMRRASVCKRTLVHCVYATEARALEWVIHLVSALVSGVVRQDRLTMSTSRREWINHATTL